MAISEFTWTDQDTMRAKAFWVEYQRTHDVSNRMGQAVGIDPVSGSVWFGKSATDIRTELEKQGNSTPLYFLRVGSDVYGHKGGRR